MNSKKAVSIIKWVVFFGVIITLATLTNYSLLNLRGV